MKVGKFMVPAERLVTCRPDDTVRDVARLVTEKRIGCVVVVEEHKEGNRPVGLVSKTDVVRVVAGGQNPDKVKAAAAASTDLHTIREDAPKDEAAERFMKDGLHHLVVVNADGRLVGLISSWDVARETALDAKAWPYTRDAAFFNQGF